MSTGLLGLLLVASLCLPAFSQPQTDYRRLIQTVDSLFSAGVENKLIPGGTIAIVTADSNLLLKSYGWADIDRQLPVADSTLFQIGSVGKVFTAMAVLQLVERGQLALDADVNTYLRGWSIDNPYPTPVTLRNLLTHSAGFNERVIGYAARSNGAVEPLGEHLRRRMPTLFQAPDTEINYSNYGYGLAGHLVELESGLPFQEYVQRHIFDLLGLETATYHLPDDYQTDAVYAKGYQNTSDGFQFVKTFPRNVPPAGSVMLSVNDMAAFASLFLRHDILLSSDAYDKLLSPQVKVHDRLTGYSLAFEQQTYQGHHFWAKGGEVPGTRAALWVLPEHGLGIFYAVNTQNPNFLNDLALALKRQLFPEGRPMPTTVPSFQLTDPSSLAGMYRSNRHNRETVEDLISLIRSPFFVNVSEGGKLEAYSHRVYQEFEEIDEGVFRGKVNPDVVLVFKTVDGERRLYLDYFVAGTTIPTSFVKVPWHETEPFIDSGYPSLWLPVIVYPLILFMLLGVWMVRRWRRDFMKGWLLPASRHLPLVFFLVMFVVAILYFWYPLLRNASELPFGLPPSLYSFRFLHMATGLVTAWIIFSCFKVWKYRSGSWLSRIYYGLFTFSAVFYMYALWRWHFLSMEA